ncbi:MAG: CHASE2 domain-containing protein, partial [Verrucomicrobiota bacterium]|nr:CHASE2 domain-containing protein [Verrucomicrobiota bacterium]
MNWIARHRRLVLAFICIFWTGLIILTLTFPEAPFFSSVVRGDQSFDDMLAREGRKTAVRSDFIFLGIDESTLNFQPFNPEDVNENRGFQLLLEHPSPWSRELWAVTLDRLFAAGARVVMFDMIFGKPFEGDEAFRAALDRYHDKVVLGVNYDLNSQVLVPPSRTLVPDGEHDDRVGYVNYFPDPLDGVIRTTRYFVSDRQLAGLKPFAQQEIFTSFSARAVQKLGEGSRLPTALEPQRLRFTAADAYDPKPLWEIFDPAVWHANYHDGATFKDKIVMIGAASQVAHDVVVTPLSSGLSGPVLHLNALAAALAGEFLRQTPVWLRYLLIISAGLVAWLLIVFVRRLVICLVSLGAL